MLSAVSRYFFSAISAGLLLFSAPSDAGTARRRRAPAKTPAIWSQLRGPLKRHISANIKENGGYFLIEDADAYNAWMGRLTKIFRNHPMQVSDEEYIVRARFVEKSLENPKKKTALLVDFNIAINEEGRWAVTAQTLYRVDKNRLFKYTPGFRRQSLVRHSGVITVSIVGEDDEPEEEAEPAYKSREVTPEQLKKEEEE